MYQAPIDDRLAKHYFKIIYAVNLIQFTRFGTMENISVFEIFKIGVGPSSSHTLGPWKATLTFLDLLKHKKPQSISVELFGSLSKTGKGHGSDIAIILGLLNKQPETIDTTKISKLVSSLNKEKRLNIDNNTITFNPETDIIFNAGSLPYHPNGMCFKASLKDGSSIEKCYYSIGGGFITTENAVEEENSEINFPYPVESEKDLLEYLKKTGKTIAEIALANECSLRTRESVLKKAKHIWQVMLESIYAGCHTKGVLPGGLKVNRRAKALNEKLLMGKTYNNIENWIEAIKSIPATFSNINNWISCFALAVNEENASFGRIVTAPTNGAAGVIPAVMLYYYCFCENKGENDLVQFLLTAALIGSIFKKGATISAAAGGCQAEIGVSSSMAAAALTELLGGTAQQVLMAAEIAMEHHLGLTCDPVKGLVQVPCIERNTMGAIKAITASNLALNSNPNQAIVNLDKVVKTMWDTAQDMNEKYKETAEGGLAINVPVSLPEC